MRRRPAGVLIGLLVVLCIVLVFAVLYPFTMASPHASTHPSDRFTAGEPAAFSANGSIVVDGRVVLAFDGVVTADGAWYQRVEEPGVVAETYQHAPAGTIYHRLTIADRSDATQRREQISANPDLDLVREERDDDRVTLVFEEHATDTTQPVSGTAAVFVNSLAVASYEATATRSSTTVYQPQSGWYDGSRPYRLTGATGEVHANAATHVVTSANLSWATTTPAGTYAEYVLVTLTSDNPTTHRITYEFEPGETDLERPTWAGDTNAT